MKDMAEHGNGMKILENLKNDTEDLITDDTAEVRRELKNQMAKAK